MPNTNEVTEIYTTHPRYLLKFALWLAINKELIGWFQISISDMSETPEAGLIWITMIHESARPHYNH